jgi:hypothetical protein
MENKYTGLALSKALHEAGFEGEGYKYEWSTTSNGRNESFHERLDSTHPNFNSTFYTTTPAFDILNDLCCKYAKEVFGEVNVVQRLVESDWYIELPASKNHAGYILFLLQQGKKQEVEDYILANSILFNKQS